MTYRRRTGFALLGLASTAAIVATTALAEATPTPTPTAHASAPAASAVGEPVDPQNWVNPDDMTWEDFRPVPGKDWADPSHEATKKTFHGAVVMVDYPNQPFVVTQPEDSTPFGLPTAEANNLDRADVPEFYRDLLNTPNDLNRGHTINEYWMEDSSGRFGIKLTAYGPYRLPGKDYEYHLPNYGNTCPKTANCDRDFREDAKAAWEADQGKGVGDKFDNIFYIGAGEDESSVWQEFGEMKFQTKEDVTDEFGPPQELKEADPTLTNWAKTRYVPWTSWQAAAAIWPNASGKTSVEAESSGRAVYAHEFSHNLGIGDNYNNPYGDPLSRTYSGIWDMLSRGTFNGPQGPHQRWGIPSTIGAQMGAHHMLRNKMELGIVDPKSVVKLTRKQLRRKGVLTTRVTAREVQGEKLTSGLNLKLTGGDRSDCKEEGHTGDKAYLCDQGGYDNYTIEVVDRMGSDSFTPDSGVLLAKTKDKDDAPFIWVKDANPQDIDLVDFTRPDGTEAMVSLGDYRQLSDALFHAGTDSGSEYEYVDEANGLAFYVLDKHRNAAGVLSYDVAVRSLASKGIRRGVDTDRPKLKQVGESVRITLPVRNTGKRGGARYGSDVYRIESKVRGQGWSVWQPHDVTAVRGGKRESVVLYATPGESSSEKANVFVTVRSESDPSKSERVKVKVSR